MRERIETASLRHRRTKWRSEQIRVEKMPHVGSREEVVTSGAVLFDAQMRLAESTLRAIKRTQHVIQPDKDRDLGQHR